LVAPFALVALLATPAHPTLAHRMYHSADTSVLPSVAAEVSNWPNLSPEMPCATVARALPSMVLPVPPRSSHVFGASAPLSSIPLARTAHELSYLKRMILSTRQNMNV